MFGPRTTGWIGFDVGDACVKAAQVVRVAGQPRIRAAAIVARRQKWNAAELTAEQPLPSADELAAAASIGGGFTGRSAAAVLPMVLCDAVQVDAVAAARRDGSGLLELVESELHQSLAGYVVAAWPGNLQADKLNVVAVPAAWSDQASSDVAAGGWNCRALDALPWALARAVALAEPAGEPRTVAALDLGYGRSTLTLVHDGAPAFVRCLKDCAYQQVLAAASARLRLPEPDAEKVLARHGLRPGDPPAAVLADALAAPLAQLERELRRTLGYWQSQSRGVKAEAVYLFGGGASLAGLADRLAAMLDLPVAVWTLPHENPANGDVLPPPHLLGPALAASALAWESP
jgi:hypothetical protein